MARITVEDCIDKFSSRFELVLVASQRAKQLHSGEKPTVEKQNDKNSVIALREIAETTIPISELKENLIKGYQTISIIEEEEIENKEYTDDKYIETTDQISSEKDIHQQIDDEIKDLSSKEDQVNEKELSEGEDIIPVDDEIKDLSSKEDQVNEKELSEREDIIPVDDEIKDLSSKEDQVNEKELSEREDIIPVDDEIKDLSSKEDQVNEKELSEREDIIPDTLKEDSTSIDS